MGHFDPLTLALDSWFDRPLIELPDALRQRVTQEFFPLPWEQLTTDHRRKVALQLDYQNDPATEKERRFWWDFFQRADELKKHIAEWEAVATPTAAELAKKETRLAELQQDLARMEAKQHAERGDYIPKRTASSNKQDASHAKTAPAVRYIAYPRAMHQLAQRLSASPEELAAWVWTGPEHGGIAAYVNANELDSPPRFSYSYYVGTSDYVAPLMGCWFKADDVEQFDPADRYIVGTALIERWNRRPGLHAEAFIQAKIAESRLLDIHPIYGGTQGTFSEHSDWPQLGSGLFPLAHILQIEAEDFDEAIETDSLAKADEVAPMVTPEEAVVVGSSEWRKQTAKAAANVLHDKPGGSRDKQRQIREIWATGKYSSRTRCAEEECAELDMSYDAARRALINTPDPSRC